MRALIAAIALLISVPANAAFNAVEFFRGKTHGEGKLKIAFQSVKTVKVDSFGFQDKDGALVIKQTVNEPGKPLKTRVWRLRETSPGHYQGTLSDAVGPVRIDQKGDTVRIRYTAKDHMEFDQVMTPAGPRQVHNKLKVKRLGLVVAHMDEVIRKLD